MGERGHSRKVPRHDRQADAGGCVTLVAKGDGGLGLLFEVEHEPADAVRDGVPPPAHSGEPNQDLDREEGEQRLKSWAKGKQRRNTATGTATGTVRMRGGVRAGARSEKGIEPDRPSIGKRDIDTVVTVRTMCKNWVHLTRQIPVQNYGFTGYLPEVLKVDDCKDRLHARERRHRG